MDTDFNQLRRVLAQVDTWSADHGCSAVFDRSGVVASHGMVDRRFSIASLTKLVTAWSVLVAVEEGSASLEDPAGPTGSTVRHLLSHASGLAFDTDDELMPPGTRRIYSNTGYERLASYLVERTGIDFSEYAREAVLTPLGMNNSLIEGSAAAGMVSTAADLCLLGAELISPQLVDSSTWHLATTPVFGALKGTLPGWGPQNPCSWGLGPEIKGSKLPHWTGNYAPADAFGHFGGSGAFLWVDPGLGQGCVVVTDRPFDDWALAVWPGFSDSVRAVLAGGDRQA